MVLWRISNYANLLGIGGMRASARWHTLGQPVVYLAENSSSALLDILIHLETDEEHRPDSYKLLKIEVADGLPNKEISLSSLSDDWKNDETETQAIGDAWIERGGTPLLRVPSTITPETWNWGINPQHALAGQVLIVKVEKHPYDPRLFQR